MPRDTNSNARHPSYVDSSSPGPNAVWTLIAASTICPLMSLISISASLRVLCGEYSSLSMLFAFRNPYQQHPVAVLALDQPRVDFAGELQRALEAVVGD